MANFSLFQQYFNPALTGFEGSLLKTFYRNQWAGFEDAPVTLFASGEVDLRRLKAGSNSTSGSDETGMVQPAGVAHAMGISLLLDQFGPLQQGQYYLNYAAGVRLSQKLQLRAGGALTYQVTRLSTSKMTLDESNDPKYTNLLQNDNRAKKLDGNVGLALTAENFYVGYSLQDIARGGLISDIAWQKNTCPHQHNLQAGYRKGLSDQFGLVVNGLYRYDEQLRESIEGQLKGIVNNTFWAGAGYRKDLAFTFLAGARLERFRVGYAREITSGKAQGLNASTNEIMFTYHLIPVAFSKLTRKISIW